MKNMSFLNNPIEDQHIIYAAKELIPHLICPVCRGLVREPILGCNKCASYGCGVCIDAWHKQGSKRCLNGCEEPNFRKVNNPLLKTVLDCIMIKCPSSMNPNEFERCREVLSYANYGQHLEQCEYRITKCVYSSCQKRTLRRLIREHEHSCKNKNPLIYFIFRDTERVPLKIEITLDHSESIENLAEQLSQKVAIPKKNIELVMIKNHEIMEYLGQLHTKNVKYLATHEGFLFGFQKHPTEDAPSAGPEIHLEVLFAADMSKFRQNMLNMHNREIQRCASYTRVLHLPHNTSFRQIHLEVYKIFRPFLRNWVEKQHQREVEQGASENQERDLFFSKFNFKSNADDAVLAELEHIRAHSPPYTLVFGENSKQEFPYTNGYFYEYYKLDEHNETQFILILALAPYLTTDLSLLKLNRCLEAPYKIGAPQDGTP